MTLARSVGATPAERPTLDRTIDRASAFAGAGVLAVLNAQTDQIISALTYQSVVQAVTNLAGISAIIWFAMYVTIKIGFEGGREKLRKNDVLVLSATVAAAFVPMSYVAQAGLLLCAAYLFSTSQTGDSARRVSLVLLALTGPLIWGRIILHALAAPLLAFDAHIVGWLIRSTVDGNVVTFANHSGRFLIGGPCSSVHNISLAIVLWTTAAASFNVRIDRRLVMFGVVMVALMFGLNIARLAAIGIFPDNFHFLHVGMGAALFGWAGLVGAGFLAAKGVSDAALRQR